MAPTRAACVLAASLAVLAALPAPAADVAALREKLALAEADQATLSRIELLRRILEADPGDGKARRELLELWLTVPDFDLAEATLAAWPDAPADLAALTRATIRRLRDEDVPGAVEILRAHLAQHPRDAAAHEALIDALLTTKDSAAQLAALDAALALEPSATNLMRRASVQRRVGRFDAALADAQAALELDPENPLVKRDKVGFERLQETVKALPKLTAAIEKSPTALRPRMDRAWWFLYADADAAALADADAALAAHADSVAARLVRTSARWSLGDIDSDEARTAEAIDVTKGITRTALLAIATADLALAKRADDATALSQRANALNVAEQYLRARRDAQAALAADGKLVPAVQELLFAESRLGNDPTPAMRRLEALKPAPEDLGWGYENLSEYALRTGNSALALEYADRALAAAETVSALRAKAVALQRLGRSEEAQQFTQRADSLQP